MSTQLQLTNISKYQISVSNNRPKRLKVVQYKRTFLYNNNNYYYYYYYYLTEIGLSPGGSDYFTCIQNMKLVTNKFKSGGLHEKHVVATWNLGNHVSKC